MNTDIPGLLPRGNAFTIGYKGRHLYADQNPLQRCEERASSYIIEDYSLVLLASPLLWYGIDVLLEKLPPHCHLLCLESNEALMNLGPPEEKAFLLQDPRVSHLKTADVTQAISLLENLGPWRFRRCVLVTLNGAYALNASLYRNFHQGLQKSIETYWKNRMTMIHMAPLWIRHIFRNLMLLPELRDAKTFTTELPVFVVGAGESLEVLLPFLKRLRSKFFLLSVDTALPILLSEDLLPDAVLCLESQAANLSDFIGSCHLAVPLFCDLLAHPETFRLLQGEKFVFLSTFSPNTLLERLELTGLHPFSFPPLGSVGVAAIHLALQISKKEVFFAGLDFSFSPGKTHSRGSPEHLKELSSAFRLAPWISYNRTIEFPGYPEEATNGRPVKTTLILETYRNTLASMIQNTSRIFNLGEHGLKIPHAKNIDSKTAEGIISSYSPIPLQKDSPDLSPKYSLDKVVLFLQKEYALLRKVYNLGSAYLSIGSETAKKTFLDALEQCDYLLLHFPDPHRKSVCDTSFTARVCTSAGHYMRVLESLLKI
ncbi:MAG: DUF115 domain-containing protein [Spirochaetales bacterium]|nr:DUF115 domain-containing protein [Spirochaetales bacterium]